MGGLSPWHLIILAVLLLVIFGGSGKLSSLMGDAAKGIRSFRDGLKGDEPDAASCLAAAIASAAAAGGSGLKSPILIAG